MRSFLLKILVPARIVGPVSLLCAGFAAATVGLAPARAAAAAGDHAQAVAALSDVEAAVGELVRADASFSTNRNVYHHATQRAINALVGTHGDGYVPGDGTPGDDQGALGHIDSLLDRGETPVWAQNLHGAEANIRGAVVHLHDALKARELMDYEIAASRALTYLEVARGHPTETGVFGGLEGALADTVLGVPEGAHQQDACAAPANPPSYGTHGGYLAWVALPATDGAHELPEPLVGTTIEVRPGMIVLDTAAAKLVASDCAAHAEAKPAAAPAQARSATPQPAAEHAAADAPPALYTMAQAEKGAKIFASKCVACHGADLQGTAAPSVAGTDFLKTAKQDDWSLWVIRYLVFTQMPRNAPASLPPQDSAAVMAFLLASNCYPAGNKPFPTADEPSFKNIKLGPLPGHHPGENEKGVCKVG